MCYHDGQPPGATAPFCLVHLALSWRPLLTVHHVLTCPFLELHAGAFFHACPVRGTMLGNLPEPLPRFAWFSSRQAGSHCSLCINCSPGSVVSA